MYVAIYSYKYVTLIALSIIVLENGPASQDNNNNGSPGAAIGGAVGAILFILIVIIIAFVIFYIRQLQRRKVHSLEGMLYTRMYIIMLLHTYVCTVAYKYMSHVCMNIIIS